MGLINGENGNERVRGEGELEKGLIGCYIRRE